MLFWQLLGPIIDKNNGKVELIKCNFKRSTETEFLNQMIEKNNLKINTIRDVPSVSVALERQLIYEYDNLKKNSLDGIEVSMIEEDLSKWRAVINGPIGSPYQGKLLVVNIQFGRLYPRLPPKFQMMTPIDHVNISVQGKFASHSLKTLSNYDETKVQTRDILNDIVNILKHPVSETQIFYPRYPNQFLEITREDPSLLDDLDALIKDKMKNGF